METLVEMETNKTLILKSALTFLANQCDGAKRKDGAGFNKLDASYGRELAILAAMDALTPAQERAAFKMIQKYRGQLEEAGIELPSLSESDNQATESTESPDNRAIRISLSPDNRAIRISFGGKPSPENLAAVKSLPSRQWLPDLPGKPWQVPAVYVKQVIETFGNNAEISEDVLRLVNNNPAPTELPPVVRLDYRNGNIWIYFEGRPSPENLAAVKSLPYRKWHPELPGKPWVTYPNAVRDVDAIFSQQKVEKTPSYLDLLEKSATPVSSPTPAVPAPVNIQGLYPFQEEGVRFIDGAGGRALIADEMGLGKTIQALVYLRLHPELRPAVIVVPASLKVNWKREAEKWLPDDHVSVLNGQKPYDVELTGANIFIINYDILNAWLDEIIRIHPAITVIDEAHYCKNARTLRTKAVMRLINNVEKLILLTGTPVLNRPKEIFTLLKMLRPEEWTSFFSFAKRYCNAKQILIHTRNGRKIVWDFSGASNLDELRQKIQGYAIRRTKANVLAELPRKTRARIIVPFEGDVRSAYLRKMAEIAPRLAELDTARQLVELEALKQAVAEGKMPSAIEWIENFVESGEKLVVFAVHIATIQALQKHFGKTAVSFYGGMNGKTRQEAVDRFQNDDNVKIFIGQLKAAGVGITLTAASNVLFLEFGWTPGDHNQAEDRCHRIGQTGSVTAWYLAAENTVDETILQLLEKKRIVVDALTDGTAGMTFPVEGGSILNDLVQKLVENGSQCNQNNGS